MEELFNKVPLNFGQKILWIFKEHKIFLIIELKCVHLLLRENGLAILKINKKKFIYLISPNRISNKFYQNLNKVLQSGKVSFFQIRLKKYSFKKKILIGKKIQQICKRNKVKLLVNDDPILTKNLKLMVVIWGKKIQI